MVGWHFLVARYLKLEAAAAVRVASLVETAALQQCILRGQSMRDRCSHFHGLLRSQLLLDVVLTKCDPRRAS